MEKRFTSAAASVAMAMSRSISPSNRVITGRPSRSWREDRMPLAESVIQLFNALPQTYFYAKDTESRFVKVNRLFLENHGLEDESQALGRTDHDFHPPLMSGRYDLHVILDLVKGLLVIHNNF